MHDANTLTIYMFHSCWWTLPFGSFSVCLAEEKKLQCIRQIDDGFEMNLGNSLWSGEKLTCEILKKEPLSFQ